MRRLRTLMAGDALPAAAAALSERAWVCVILPIQLVKTAKRPSITTISTMLVTTALVAERPTEARTGAGRKPALAADRRDRQAENGGLDDAEDEVPRRHRPEQLVVELQEADVEGRHHQRATEESDDIGQDREQRHHQHRREQPRQDQEVDRVEPEGRDRVHLLVDLLRADLRGERGPGASGEHDGGHQRAELAQHGDAHAVHDEDHRTELRGPRARSRRR